MARYLAPEQYVRQMKHAAFVAYSKGMKAEAAECARLAREAEAKIG